MSDKRVPGATHVKRTVTMRCRPGTVTHTAFAKVRDQRCSAVKLAQTA
jgi:hypothetical protein